MKIQWARPENPKRASREDLREFRSALKKQPGRWAVHPTDFSTAASAAASGTIWRQLGFDTAARGTTLFVRWTGRKSS